MKSENFVVIQGWMCNELELKGNELLVFALIYGFSQDGVSKFHGTRQYIADTFNISRPTVDKALQGLVEKKYICKEGFDDFVNPNIYWVNLDLVKKLYTGCKETLQGGCKETLLNNNSKQTDKEKRNNSKELLQNSDFQFGKSKPKKESLFTKCVTLTDDFISQHNCGNPIRKKLIEYLNYRLSVKDKPLYTNMWKGMLNKLDLLHKEGYAYESIINFSLERGYLSFYPPSNFSSQSDVTKGKAWEENVSCRQATEEELEDIERLNKERKAKGLRVTF